MSLLMAGGIDPARVPDTSLDAVDRVVVVVPHPDDEALASGLLLADAARWNLAVHVVAVTDGEAAYPDHDPTELAVCRRREQAASLAELGITQDRVERVGLPDGRVADHVERLAGAIAPHLLDDGATLLVAPSIHDWHPDHEACGHAARLALRDHPRPDTVTHWSSVFWAHHHPEPLLASRPRLVRLTGTPADVAARRRAVECHRSQFDTSPGDEPVLDGPLIAHLDSAIELYVVEHS